MPGFETPPQGHFWGVLQTQMNVGKNKFIVSVPPHTFSISEKETHLPSELFPI